MDYKRTNGFSWPLDKAQMTAWTFLIYFGLMIVGTFIPSMVQPWSISLGVVFFIFYLLHLILNITVMAIK